MPLLKSEYQPIFPFTKKHFNTVFRTLFTKTTVNYNRNRLELQDGDFMDIDFIHTHSKTVVIALHGLEGSSQSSYMLTLSKLLSQHNFDVAAVNLRGCSGEPNQNYSSYHSGKTDDLEGIVNYILSNYNYENIYIVGYSLGGNILLKYLGEQQSSVHSKIKATVAVSVPCDLASSSKVLAKRSNKIYMNRFLKTLKSKAVEKNNQFPEAKMPIERLLQSKNFLDFDDLYTAPAHGFKNAEEYWRLSSSKPFLEKICTPTLMISALDDPFMSEACFPFESAKNNSSLSLETPKYGGHVGFNTSLFPNKNFWLEHRILEFFQSLE